MIAPIGDAGSDVRRRSNQILKHLISPAVMHCGYAEPVRADKLSEAGMITTQVIQKILQVPLVIADLTGRNPNVYYELALRHAVRRPCVQIIAQGETLPFDVAGFRTIQVNHQDLDNVEEAREEMIRQVRSMDGRIDVDSPVSTAIDLESFKTSKKPEERLQAEMMAAFAELRAEVVGLSRKLSENDSERLVRSTPPLRFSMSVPAYVLPGVGPRAFDRLQNAGIETLADVDEASVDLLASIEGIGPRLALKIKSELAEFKQTR